MQKLGIIAGGGILPLTLIQACKRDGKDFFLLAIEGQTDEAIVKNIPHQWVKLGATNKAIAILKAQNVDTVVMAGSVRRPVLSEIKPDWRTVQLFIRLGKKALGDDAMLRAVAEEFEKDGFKIIGVQDIEPQLITPEGVLGKKQPRPEHSIDIAYGVKAVKTLGILDIGQSAVVQQGIVLGVEAVEGTDALLARCQTLRRKGRGGVLVKGCKPQQDKRMDLPTIGMRTIRNAYLAGLEGIAIEADASLILNREEVIAAADKLGIFIMGYKSE